MKRNTENDKACRTDAMSVVHYMEYLFRALGYARIWSTESSSPLKILLSTGATIVFMLANSLLLFSEIAALTLNINMKLFANIIGVIGMHAVGLMKWCYCMWKNRNILDIVAQLEKCHVFCQKIDKSEEGYRIYRNEMEYVRKYSNVFVGWWTCACIYGTLHWCANPLILEWSSDRMNSINRTFKQRNLPYFAWYPLNTNDIYTYVYLYLMQIIGGISSALGIICYDSFYVIMLIVICVQFQYINIIMMKINFDNVPEAKFVLERKLKKCVDCHTEIIKFLKMLQTFSGPTMFAQCIETLVILCLISFEASTIKIAIDIESILKLWSLLEYFLCATIQLYFFCFFATRLEHLGLQIANSVYFCGWELMILEKKAQVDFRKELKQCSINQLVQTIIMRAQKPIVLTGGPFYKLSLETFRIIISMAMSNSVMLRTISDLDD